MATPNSPGGITPILGQYGYVPPESPPSPTFSTLTTPKDSTFSIWTTPKDSPPLLKNICFFAIFSSKIPLVFQWGAALKAPNFQRGATPYVPPFSNSGWSINSREFALASLFLDIFTWLSDNIYFNLCWPRIEIQNTGWINTWLHRNANDVICLRWLSKKC